MNGSVSLGTYPAGVCSAGLPAGLAAPAAASSGGTRGAPVLPCNSRLLMDRPCRASAWFRPVSDVCRRGEQWLSSHRRGRFRVNKLRLFTKVGVRRSLPPLWTYLKPVCTPCYGLDGRPVSLRVAMVDLIRPQPEPTAPLRRPPCRVPPRNSASVADRPAQTKLTAHSSYCCNLELLIATRAPRMSLPAHLSSRAEGKDGTHDDTPEGLDR